MEYKAIYSLFFSEMSSGEVAFILSETIQLCGLLQYFLRLTAEMESHVIIFLVLLLIIKIKLIRNAYLWYD